MNVCTVCKGVHNGSGTTCYSCSKNLNKEEVKVKEVKMDPPEFVKLAQKVSCMVRDRDGNLVQEIGAEYQDAVGVTPPPEV